MSCFFQVGKYSTFRLWMSSFSFLFFFQVLELGLWWSHSCCVPTTTSLLLGLYIILFSPSIASYLGPIVMLPGPWIALMTSVPTSLPRMVPSPALKNSLSKFCSVLFCCLLLWNLYDEVICVLCSTGVYILWLMFSILDIYSGLKMLKLTFTMLPILNLDSVVP